MAYGVGYDPLGRRGTHVALTQGTPLRRIFLTLILCSLPTLAPAVPLGLPALPVPHDNPQTPAKIALGDKLFHDARLSGTGEISCSSCHLDAIAFSDGRPVSRGVRKAKGTRNAPTALNAAYSLFQFWDGRAESLEQQAAMPLLNPIEHGLGGEADVLRIVEADPNYRALFRAAFMPASDAISMQALTQAIAAYERSLIAGDSAFDRWFFGKDAGAVDDAARRGYEVFSGAGRCSSCHRIEQDHALFIDQAFHNVNAGFWRLGAGAQAFAQAYVRAQPADTEILRDPRISELGRFVVTRRAQDIGAFKTPTLRNVARTSPYLHDGSLNTLAEVVEFFDRGGWRGSQAPSVPNPYLSPLIRPLNLTSQQKNDLVAFLESLTSEP